MRLAEHNRHNMKKQNITKFLQSVVTIPLFAIVPITGIASQAINPSIEIGKIVSSVIEPKVIITPEEQVRIERAAKIDALLEKYNSPLAGYGMKFVIEAEKNDIEWNLLVSIAGVESTFARHACKKATNSFLGYGSCKIDFKSADDAIEKVSASLGGNNPNTAHHYDGKTTAQILRKYNSVIPDYPQKVYRIMKMIDNTKIDDTKVDLS
jgi:hypothetical protein